MFPLEVLMGIRPTPKRDSLPPAIFHIAENAFFKDIASWEVGRIFPNLPVDWLTKEVFSDQKHLVGKSLFGHKKDPFFRSASRRASS